MWLVYRTYIAIDATRGTRQGAWLLFTLILNQSAQVIVGALGLQLLAFWNN